MVPYRPGQEKTQEEKYIIHRLYIQTNLITKLCITKSINRFITQQNTTNKSTYKLRLSVY